MGGYGAPIKNTGQVDPNVALAERGIGISPWGLVVPAWLDCNVKEVSWTMRLARR